MKRLYRTEGRDATICGVCGGIAEYFGIDPTLVRVATTVLIFAGGLSLWVYLIALAGWALTLLIRFLKQRLGQP